MPEELPESPHPDETPGSEHPARAYLNLFLIYGLIPASIYFLCFALLTFPTIEGFGSRLFSNSEESFSSLWNIWHVKRSLLAHTLPFHTDMIHFPEGTTLLGHTLSLTNSLPGALLSFVFTQYQAFNILVIFNVVATGLSAFLLAYYFSRAYLPSLLAGFIYAFSGYAALHLAVSHMNLMSMQWLPLFILVWHMFLRRPGLKLALAAAAVLILTAYDDLYYLFYAVVAGMVFLLVFFRRNGIRLYLTRRVLASFAVFGGVFLLIAGPYLVALILTNNSDELLGSHSPVHYSIDLLGPFIPGFLKGAYGAGFDYREMPGEDLLGLVAAGIIVYGLINWKRWSSSNEFKVWAGIMAGSFIFALGPALHIASLLVDIPMPYSVVMKLIPPARLAGMPDRVMSLFMLSAALLVAVSLSKVVKSRRGPLVVAVLALLVVAVDYYPVWRVPMWDYQIMSSETPGVAGYVDVLKDQPDKGAVYDFYTDMHPDNLLFQTIHGHPMFGGFLARTPQSVSLKDIDTEQYYYGHDYDGLCHEGFRYVVVDGDVSIDGARELYGDPQKRLYDLSNYDSYCQEALSQPREEARS